MQKTFQCAALYFGLVMIATVVLFLVVPIASAAPAEFVPLVGVPNVQDDGDMGLVEYINALYLLTIGIGSLIAVIKISWAGVQWAMSDVVTDKSEARRDIKGALLGLAILLLPFLVLSTINPNLTNLDVLNIFSTDSSLGLD